MCQLIKQMSQLIGQLIKQLNQFLKIVDDDDVFRGIKSADCEVQRQNLPSSLLQSGSCLFFIGLFIQISKYFFLGILAFYYHNKHPAFISKLICQQARALIFRHPAYFLSVNSTEMILIKISSIAPTKYLSQQDA